MISLNDTSSLLLAALATLVGGTGCNTIADAFHGERGHPGEVLRELPWSSAAAAGYDGPECARVLYQPDELKTLNSFPFQEDPSTEAQVLLATCRRREYDVTGRNPHNKTESQEQEPRIRAADLEKLTLVQNDRHLDVAQLAAAVVLAVRENVRVEWQPPTKKNAVLALYWARVISAKDLSAALARTRLPEGAKRALVKNLQQIPALIGELLTRDEREALVDAPVAEFRERKAHFREYADLYARLDKLVVAAEKATGKPEQLASVVAELEAVRGDFMRKCGQIECSWLALFAEATDQLGKIHAARGNVLAARAESSFFSGERAYMTGFPQSLRVSQENEVKNLAQIHYKREQATESGADARTADQVAGGKGALIETHLLLDAPLHLPDYAAAIGAAIQPLKGEVAQVSTRGPVTEVRFRSRTFIDDISYECKRTDRIERIDPGGYVVYEEVCKTKKQKRIETEHAPVRLPAREGSALRPGDLVTFVRDDQENGLVLEVVRGDRVIQIREIVIQDRDRPAGARTSRL